MTAPDVPAVNIPVPVYVPPVINMGGPPVTVPSSSTITVNVPLVPAPLADPAKPINDYVVSLIRTGVPYGVGAACAFLASKGLHVPASDAALVDPILAAGLGTLYYGLVRAAEKRWPKIGVLLGWVATVAYKRF